MCVLGDISCIPFSKQTSYLFKCAEQDGDVRIRMFIQKAFDWYCKAMESTEDNSRYLYTLISTGGMLEPEPSGWGDECDCEGPVRK